MKTVLQIIIGDLPERLIPYVESVKKFADINGHKYEVLTEPDPDLIGLDERTISNWMRIRRMQIPGMAYFDWDILIKDFSIELGDEPVIGIDHIFYFGNRMDLAKKLLDQMGDVESNCAGLDVTYLAIQELEEQGISFDKYLLSRKRYKHLGYARFVH